MAFSDLCFIFVFLPVFVILQNIAPPALRKHLMFIGGVLFYLAGLALSPPDSLLEAAVFPAVMLFTWISGRVLTLCRKSGPSGDGTVARAALFLPVTVLTALLAMFKYSFPAMPPGMSFYIFTAIAYLADVGVKGSPAGGLAGFGAYFAFFPKLLSGPITRWDDMRPQLGGEGCGTGGIAEGMRLFIAGLAEKVLLADTVGRLWTSVRAVGADSISTPLAWLGAVAFSLMLYHDFNGYSVMACGIGRMLGVELPRNFDYPYMSRSVSEFWRKWHITLGRWFRDYVYIPLGGSRSGSAATVFNLLVVWLLTGVWHGATVNFLLWGLMMFVLIAAEKLLLGKFLDRHKIISRVYMLIIIPVSWMLFANTDTEMLAVYFGRMFSYDKGLAGVERYIGSYAVSLSAAVLFCTPYPAKLFEKIRCTVTGALIYAALFAASVYLIWFSGSGPFMYFSF